MNLQLSEKVIIVTGGAKGIGKAIVDTLLEEGAIPVIIDKDGDALNEQQQALKAHRQQSWGIEADLTQPAECQHAVDETYSRFGDIHGLVNNAGINDKIGLEAGPEAFMGSIRRNLLHVYTMTHYALPFLKKTRGPIVNVSSKTALTGQGGTSGYIAAKGGVLALTREWALELREHRIRVNCVVPAEVMTPMYREYISSYEDPDARQAEIENQIPFEKRMTTPREMAHMVVFLLSAKSSHTTGQWLHVDGGYVHLDRMAG